MKTTIEKNLTKGHTEIQEGWTRTMYHNGVKTTYEDFKPLKTSHNLRRLVEENVLDAPRPLTFVVLVQVEDQFDLYLVRGSSGLMQLDSYLLASDVVHPVDTILVCNPIIHRSFED